MLRLVTGSPGDGKTSNELWDFINDPKFSGRPKFCTPINGFEPEKHGVKAIDHVKVWQDLPDGSVIFIDEVQDYIGTDIGKEPPEWAKQLARHRHRGFDFIFTTQSPMFMHSFVRKLCKPHIHYTRPWNMKCFRFEWETVQGDPNSRSAKNSALRKPITTNPKVFDLYTSTVLDTHKKRPPYKIIIGFTIAVILFIFMTWFAVHKLSAIAAGSSTPPVVSKLPPQHDKPLTQRAASSIAPEAPPKAVWDSAGMTPRLPGLPHTAPIYDQLTAPTDFPRVAACMSSRDDNTCNCYTQQATPIEVPRGACEVFVKHGSFDPWLSGRRATLAKAGIIDQDKPKAPFQSTADQSQLGQLSPQPEPQAVSQPASSEPRPRVRNKSAMPFASRPLAGA